MLVSNLISGLVVGSIYALMGLAMSITYKASEIANFAQGEMAMISTFITFVLLTGAGWPFYLALLATLVFAFVLGAILEFGFIRRAKDPSDLSFIIITIGFQMLIYGIAGWKWGPDQKALDLPFSNLEMAMTFWTDNQGNPIGITELNLATILSALLLMGGLWAFLRYTKLGLAMKASQQNQKAARINGIPTNRILGISFGISAIVGAVAGILVSNKATLDPQMMWDPLLKGFAAAVLGGLKSLPGVVLGGYMLGIAENLFGHYISIEFKSVVAFAAIVLILFFKPSGLLGKHYVRKV